MDESHFCPALTKLALDLHVNFCLCVCLSVCLCVCLSVCLYSLFNHFDLRYFKSNFDVVKSKLGLLIE